MTVFKTFLKILNKNKWILLLYTGILIFYGIFNFQNQEQSMNFNEETPDIFIINQDTNNRITENFLTYLEKNTKQIKIENTEEARSDALFYRNINLEITIPENYGMDFLNGKNPELIIRSTGDYQSSLATMLIKRYQKIAKTYLEFEDNIDNLMNKINETLESEIAVEMTSKRDTNSLNKVAAFYNFSNYSMLAGCIYMICLVLSSFKEERVLKRTMMGKKHYKTINRELFLSNTIFAFTLSSIYILLSFFLIGNVMFSMHGLLFITNFFFFTICALAIAFLLGNIVQNKEAINGIINVIALGSSFLCGAFVPSEFLPPFVLKIAHILPSFYFINNNETISKLEEFNFESLNPFFINLIILILFTILLICITNMISRKKQKIA